MLTQPNAPVGNSLHNEGFAHLPLPTELLDTLTNLALSPIVVGGIRPGVPAGMPGYLFGVDVETARYAKLALDRMLAAV